jgi:hypothetical protein
MTHNSYYPVQQGKQTIWLGNFANKLPAYAAQLGLATATVNAAVADCLWLIYVMTIWVPEARAWSLASSKAKTAAQTGQGIGAQVLPVFTAPALPGAAGSLPATMPVAPGALTRIFALVQQIKTGGKSNPAIDRDLGLVGPDKVAADLAGVQPALTLTLVTGQVRVGWIFGGLSRQLDSCEILVDRGDGSGFGFLTISVTPGFTDPTPLPATPAKWTYKAMYRVGDSRVGQWSAPASIHVGA